MGETLGVCVVLEVVDGTAVREAVGDIVAVLESDPAKKLLRALAPTIVGTTHLSGRRFLSCLMSVRGYCSGSASGTTSDCSCSFVTRSDCPWSKASWSLLVSQ